MSETLIPPKQNKVNQRPSSLQCMVLSSATIFTVALTKHLPIPENLSSGFFLREIPRSKVYPVNLHDALKLHFASLKTESILYN